jgi:hypothetical protein
MEEGGIGTAGHKEEACAMYCAEPSSRDEIYIFQTTSRKFV